MAQDIVGGLFGINPQDVMRQQVNAEMNAATNYANLNPFQQANYGGMLAGQMLGRGIGGLMGAEDPRLVQAKQIQQVKQWIASSGVDINTPEGLAQAAQYAQSIGATEGAMYLGQQSTALRQQQATAMRTEQQAAREEQRFKLEDQLRSELAALGPNPSEEQVIGVVTKYGDPTQILKILEAKAAKTAEEGNAGVAGPVGKGGAYRDISGNILGASEMAKNRQEFETLQRAYSQMSKITSQDTQTAESWVDWTTKGTTTKKLASEGVVDAQTKVAANQLLEQIQNLPPGAASDADMKAAASSFPGYGNKKDLDAWVNRTKEKLQEYITRMSDRFGWKPTVKFTAPIGEQQAAGQAKVRKFNPQTGQIE